VGEPLADHREVHEPEGLLSAGGWRVCFWESDPAEYRVLPLVAWGYCLVTTIRSDGFIADRHHAIHAYVVDGAVVCWESIASPYHWRYVGPGEAAPGPEVTPDEAIRRAERGRW